MQVENFGRNVRFEPRTICIPGSVSELIETINREKPEHIRVIASGHAWSPLIETDDFLVDLKFLNQVEVFEEHGETLVRIGGGCQIKHLIEILNQSGVTLPSIGLITEQRIAGAISTGTHGSGKHSLSHYVRSLSIVCYEEESEEAVLKTIDAGPELQAARCSLGCLGIIVEVVMPCIPQYLVAEGWTVHEKFEDAFQREAISPLQQFFLLPHSWKYYCQERVVSQRTSRSTFAWLYSIYWWLCFDLGMHLGILLSARWCRSKTLVRFLFRRVVPIFVPRWGATTDRSDRILTMEHELFRHLELELFVLGESLSAAADYVKRVLRFADSGTDTLTDDEKRQLEEWGLDVAYQSLRESYTHHYPICFRKIKADETMISMSSGSEVTWYSLSLITYVEPRGRFYDLATFLTRSMARMYGARIHWGKWFPKEHVEVISNYPRLEEFRTVAQKYDPREVFRNEFIDRVIFDNEQ
ncbi:MAG: FAD-binding protein [Planctomycetaceae bacterium]|nr:FAD-binding protein [Planctomycetaceae bacterium]